MSEDCADRRSAQGVASMPSGDHTPEAAVTTPLQAESSPATVAASTLLLELALTLEPTLAPTLASASALAPGELPSPPANKRRFDGARGWWSAASPNVRGSLLMVMAFTFLAVMTTLIKLIGGRVPIVQILIVRQLVMTCILVALVGHALPSVLRTQRPGLQMIRGLFSLGAMLCGFTALINLPMAEATALGFSQVLFVTLLAIFVLREVVDSRRWIAMAVGFCGVVVMLRPTGEALNGYALLAIAGALFGAGITVTVRVLGHSEKTETILFWQGGVIFLALIGPSIYFWVPPTPAEWALMIGLGVVGTVGQWLITRAYQMGEASALAPLDFVRLLLATASGYLVFSEIPGGVTTLGAALVVGGTILTMRRNAGPSRAVARPVD